MKTIVKYYDFSQSRYLQKWLGRRGVINAHQRMLWFQPVDSRYDNCKETLYRTKKGSFFIIGEGESNTMWSKPDMDYGTWPLGYAMVHLTEQETRNWLEFRELYSEYEEIFGMPEEA